MDELDPREERERERIIPLIAQGLAMFLRGLGWAGHIDLIIPIPSDPSRVADRGQSSQHAIAIELAKILAIPCRQDIVRKMRSTQKLQGLAVDERKHVLTGTMQVDLDKLHLIQKRHILLVDDVVTYGTHFQVASAVLEDAGVRSVQCCAIASARDNLHLCTQTDD